MDLEDPTPTVDSRYSADARQPRVLPYRWGYFQGVFLLPLSFLLLLDAASGLIQTHRTPWYLTSIDLLMGLTGLPLAVGLLRKKKYALSLVYVMFGLSLFQALIQIPIAIRNFADQGDKGSAFFAAECLLFWLLSVVYYRKRREQFGVVNGDQSRRAEVEIQSEKPQWGWLRAHWKIILATWLGLALSGAAMAFIVMRTSEPAKIAISRAESNTVLAERLGRPLKRGWFVSGSIEITPASGHAELAIPISGPKGHGTLYMEARKRAGLWQLELLQFASEGSDERLDLLASDTTPQATTAPQ
jgi:hypothetical protein